jgi:hypothetical protein
VRATLSAPADGFVTVIVHAGTDGVPRISTIIEEMNFNRARVRVGFYNAFAGCAAASLRVEPDGPSIFDGVPPGEGRQRTVNPVRAQVGPLVRMGVEPGWRWRGSRPVPPSRPGWSADPTGARPPSCRVT